MRTTLAYLKTHKTGSSTLSTVVNRITDSRHLKSMYPPGGVFLGWPGTFPGHSFGPGRHQFDVISNHAVYDPDKMRTYLRETPPPFFFTIVRDAVERSSSAFNFWKPDSFPNWAQHINRIRSTPLDHRFVASYANSMAHDLGWYNWDEYGAGSTRHDSDASRIDAFVSMLNRTIDVVLVLDDGEGSLDKSLLIFGRAAGFSVPELAYTSMKMGVHNGPSSPKAAEHKDAVKHSPSDAQRGELRSILRIDDAIYTFFRDKMRRQWASSLAADPTLAEDLAMLQCLNEQLATGCAHGQGPQCHVAYQRDSSQYTNALHEHNGFANGRL